MDLMPVFSKTIDILWVGFYYADAWFLYRLLCSMAQKKGGWICSAVVFISCAYISNMIIYANDAANVTLDFFWFTAVVLFAFRGKLMPRLSVVAILYPLIIALNFLVTDIFTRLYVISGKNLTVHEILRLTDGLIHVFFWYALLKIFGKKLSRIVHLYDVRTWLLLGTVCFASMVNITACIYFSPEESWKMWASAFSCIVTNIGSLYLAGYFSDSILNDMERQNLKLKREYYEQLEQNQTELRKFRHDVNNHLAVIKSLLADGDISQAEACFREVENTITETNRVFCKNSIINAVLNAKYNLAAAREIDCFFNIDLGNVLSMDAVSLCSLFSNTLDNAIDACLKIPDTAKRKISVKARVTETGYFSYEIKNTKNNPVIEKKGRFFSDKEDSRSHGFGLQNVRDVVEKYSGTLDISYTDDAFLVIVLIGGVT